MSLPFGCRIGLDLTTTNNIAFGGVGPELAVPLGAIEPYARATMGFSYWFTNSSLSGYDDEAEFGNTTHLSDGMLAWRAGAGVRMRVSNGSKPISNPWSWLPAAAIRSPQPLKHRTSSVGTPRRAAATPSAAIA
jgi:hypothetical protein